MHTPASYVCSGTSTNSTTALDDTDWWTAYILVILTGTLASIDGLCKRCHPELLQAFWLFFNLLCLSYLLCDSIQHLSRFMEWMWSECELIVSFSMLTLVIPVAPGLLLILMTHAELCKYFNKCSDYPTCHQHCKPSSQELALCFRYIEIKVWSLTYWARSNYRKEISQSLQQQWGALPFSQPEVLEEDLSLAAFVRISQHGMEITEKVFWVPGWSEDLRGSFTATIFLWLKQSYLCHLESLMVMTLSFYPRVSQKNMSDERLCNLLLENCVLCFTASLLIIMDMSCLKWSLISGFQMCFPTIWVTIIFAVNFSRKNQTEFNFVQTSSVCLNGQSITFMIRLSQNEILIEWCCHFRELCFF